MDKRTIKTKANIKASFIKLLGVLDYNSISIKNICDEAIISRKTFYYYYDSIFALVDDLKNDFTNDILEATKDIDLINKYAPEMVYEKIKELLTNFLQNNESILSNRNNYDFVIKALNILIKYIKEKFIDPLRVNYDKDKVDIFINYAVHGFVGSYQEWLNGSPRISYEEFSKKFKLIFFNGLNELIK